MEEKAVIALEALLVDFQKFTVSRILNGTINTSLGFARSAFACRYFKDSAFWALLIAGSDVMVFHWMILFASVAPCNFVSAKFARA